MIFIAIEKVDDMTKSKSVKILFVISIGYTAAAIVRNKLTTPLVFDQSSLARNE